MKAKPSDLWVRHQKLLKRKSGLTEIELLMIMLFSELKTQLDANTATLATVQAQVQALKDAGAAVPADVEASANALAAQVASLAAASEPAS